MDASAAAYSDTGCRRLIAVRRCLDFRSGCGGACSPLAKPRLDPNASAEPFIKGALKLGGGAQLLPPINEVDRFAIQYEAELFSLDTFDTNRRPA